jgi:hypothetical protein
VTYKIQSMGIRVGSSLRTSFFSRFFQWGITNRSINVSISADDGNSGNSKLAAEFDALTAQNLDTQVEKYKLLAEFWRFLEVPGRQVFSGCFMLILCREQH